MPPVKNPCEPFAWRKRNSSMFFKICYICLRAESH